MLPEGPESWCTSVELWLSWHQWGRKLFHCVSPPHTHHWLKLQRTSSMSDGTVLQFCYKNRDQGWQYWKCEGLEDFNKFWVWQSAVGSLKPEPTSSVKESNSHAGLCARAGEEQSGAIKFKGAEYKDPLLVSQDLSKHSLTTSTFCCHEVWSLWTVVMRPALYLGFHQM